jgi:DNA mismatch repair ATPase MutS
MAAVFVDDHTLRDLEIYPGRDGGPCIFGVLDNTKTKGGRAALRARFANPLDSAEAIRQVQRGIGYLIDHSIQFAVAQDLIDDVRWYLVILGGRYVET